MKTDKVNILLVDDQPAKLLSHQVVLRELDENLLTAGDAREALEILLKHEVAVVLIDVCMPGTDGFELASMIHGHPRFRETAIIFISAILFNDVDRLRGYEMGAVDYVSVPVIPEVLRAKVRVFVDLHRKTRQLEQLNRNLEARVAERTTELAASAMQLRRAEQLRSLALAAGQMGSWEWDVARGKVSWDQGQHDIFGVDPGSFVPSRDHVAALIHPEDRERVREVMRTVSAGARTCQGEFRVQRSDGAVRWCVGVVAASFDERQRLVHVSGVTVDITERKHAEERLILLAEEVDHRARNVVAVIQAIMRLTRSGSIDEYIGAIDGRIRALSTAHKLLAKSRWEGADLDRLVDEELAPYRARDHDQIAVSGPGVVLPPPTAQTIALALHELVTNAAKYGALSTSTGHVEIRWEKEQDRLTLTWIESGGPPVSRPSREGYGTRVIKVGVERQHGGQADFNWLPGGLRCTLSMRCEGKAQILDRKPGESKTSDGRYPPVIVIHGTGKPIFLVEDEPLISMMLANMLVEKGHKVDGPYTRLSDAMAAARNNDIQVGILDINVCGEDVYPIADTLAERNIPFVFVTGYSADGIEPRFSHIPVLQKPLEPERLLAALEGAL